MTNGVILSSFFLAGLVSVGTPTLDDVFFKGAVDEVFVALAFLKI